MASTLYWVLALSLLWSPFANAGTYQQITVDFGPNPRNVGFWLYVPDTLQASPPILVNPHWCKGSANATYTGTPFAALADTYGFIIIFPDSPNLADKCWDVSSAETLSHDGGGDSLGIVSMVRWTLGIYGGDPLRVFSVGQSSGAMMTNVLLGAYPELFAAGSGFAGVPFGCMAPDPNQGVYAYWNTKCIAGNVTHTPAEWASWITNAYPGYDGWRPRVQLWHGTKDRVLYYTNFGEEIKQWTEVFGLGSTPYATFNDTPVAGTTKYVYGESGWFEAFSVANGDHYIALRELEVMRWFDLACTQNCFGWGTGGP